MPPLTSLASSASLHRLARGLALLPFTVLTAWCAAAVAWAPSGPAPTTWALAAATVGACVMVGFGPLPRLVRGAAIRTATITTVWGTIIAWFLLLPAPADAEWQPDVAQAPDFEIDGDLVTVSGIRHFRYGATDLDFVPAWDDRTFDLRRIRTVDLFFSFWGPTLICHNFVTFGFETPDGWDHVAVSIEVRKRRGQSYSAVGGLFRQFALVFIWAEERDVVRVRTDFRGESVHRYRLLLTDAQARNLFLHYLDETRRLREAPRWYNAVTQSCGVDIIRTASGDRMGVFPSPWQLLNGTWERRAWDFGRLGPAATFEEERAAANVTADAKMAPSGSAREFSAAIRKRDTTWRPAVEIRGRP